MCAVTDLCDAIFHIRVHRIIKITLNISKNAWQYITTCLTCCASSFTTLIGKIDNPRIRQYHTLSRNVMHHKIALFSGKAFGTCNSCSLVDLFHYLTRQSQRQKARMIIYFVILSFFLLFIGRDHKRNSKSQKGDIYFRNMIRITAVKRRRGQF